MKAPANARLSRGIYLLPFAYALLAGCFGTGEGQQSIPGTPAAEGPGDDVVVDCDSAINFEDACGAAMFMDFAGGSTAIVDNPGPDAVNGSEKVARAQKFAAEPFGGTTLALNEDIDLADGTAIRVAVWAERPVPMLFKFEGLNVELTENHSGSASWEFLCFDFAGTTGTEDTGITVIFDNGVVGDAANDPSAWTFYFDEIEQLSSCDDVGGGGGAGGALSVDFEGDAANFDFGEGAGFAGGVTIVTANPDTSGINASPQAARSQKFAGEPFGGSTLSLGSNVDFSEGEVFKVQVRADRRVPLLFKFEGLDQERTLEHSGSGVWEELCYDFRGSTAGPASNAITFIFDNGVLGDADNDSANWTFFIDNIQQDTSCGDEPDDGDDGPSFTTITFDDPNIAYALRGFGGAEDSTLVADPGDAGSQVAQVNRSDAAETFAGTVVSTGENETVGALPLNAMAPQMTVRVRSPGVGIPVRLKVENSGDPAISVETEVMTTVANEFETLTFNFLNQAEGTSAFNPAAVYDRVAIFFNFGATGGEAGAQTFLFDDVAVVGAEDDGGDGGGSNFDAITFDDPALTYATRGFGGAEDSVIAADPADGANMVLQVNRSDAAETFAGTVISTSDNETVGTIPLDAMAPQMTVRVNGPQAGAQIRLKVENSADATISVETEATTTVANGWETLTFNFLDQAEGTAAFDPAATYDRVVLFFNFGASGADVGAQTWFADDIDVVGSGADDGGDDAMDDGGADDGTSLDFEGDPAGFVFDNFAGGVSTVVDNPAMEGINTSAQVVQMQKFAGDVFGGSTLALPEGIDFANGPAFTMKVWSRRVVPVLFKLEGLNQERSADHDGGAMWQDLCYDFTGATSGDPVTGVTVIFDLGNAGDAENDPDNWTFFYDDIQQTTSCSADDGDDGGADDRPAFETITFDDPDIAYALRGFEGAEDSSLVVDPVDASSMVLRVNRSEAAQLFAGTVISTGDNESSGAINLDPMAPQMTVRVNGPQVGAQIRLKIEDSTDETVSVETEATTTVANGWETLTFDFLNQVSGTAAFDPSATYDKIVLFFNFGAEGGDVGAQTWFADDIAVALDEGEDDGELGAGFETVTFDDAAVEYTLRGFEGAEDSSLAVDPLDGANMVLQVNRSAEAQLFAGTVISTLPNESVGEIELDPAAPVMSVRVNGPAAGAQIRLKIEDSTDETVSVETEATTSIVDGWESLNFNFSNPVANTAAFDPNATYDKIVLFFNFGAEGAGVGAQTWYADDIAVGAASDGGDDGDDGVVGPTNVDFEGDPAAFDFGPDGGFDGGVSTVIENPVSGGINTSAQVAQMQKFAGADFGGSTLQLPEGIDFANGEAFTVRVWSTREVPLLFKLEGLNQERSAAHAGGSQWQELCYDFAGATAGDPVSGITFIFDLGAVGDAANDPDFWTFYYDDVRQTTSCPIEDDDGGDDGDDGGVEGPTTLDFEGDPANFEFEDFEGGVATVIDNPVASGLNTSAQVVQMQKFAGEDFGGSTLPLPAGVDFTQGEAFTMTVWSPRTVPVLFKLEGLNQERPDDHDGGAVWQELCYDFSGMTNGEAVTGITVIFDLGMVGDAANNPDDWTFYYDDIQQTTSCPAEEDEDDVADRGVFETITFDNPDLAYALRGFEGAEDSALVVDPVDASSMVLRVNRSNMAQSFAGTVIFTGDNESVGVIDLDPVAPQMTVRVNGPQAGAQIRLKIEDSTNEMVSVETEATTTLADGWETLTFDFLNPVANTAAFDSNATYDKVVLFFNFGIEGTDAGLQTWFADDIAIATQMGEPGLFPVDFEAAADTYDFGPEAGFEGGVSTVIPNPVAGGLNGSAQVAQMQKFEGEDFAGSTLSLGEDVDFTRGEAFRMKVWASRSVPVLFKFEGLDQERALNHSGSGMWEELCFDFTNTALGGAPSNAITFIFDLGTVGDAMGSPDDWTFFFDDIEQVDNCGPPAEFPIDFEAAPDSYDFGPEAGFAGGVSLVVPNPDQSGLNTTAQTVRMQKFGGETFAGSTLSLGASVDFDAGESFRMKVWSARPVPVLFKFETLNQERTVNHPGGGTWEELCFDFGGTTIGPRSNAITFIFDNGVLGDADGDAENWTFYYDEIEQIESCPLAQFPITFEDAPDSYDFGPDAGFGGGVSEVVGNPDASGLNTTPQVAQMRKFAGEPFGGSTLSAGSVDFSDGEIFTMKVWSARPVPVLFKFETLNREREVLHPGGSAWQELCFDFTGDTAGPRPNAITFIFDNGVPGNAGGDANSWTFFYDEITRVDECGEPPPDPEPLPMVEPVDFESGEANFADFEGGVATVISNPDASGINPSDFVGEMQKFAGATFAGSTYLLGDAFSFASGDSYLMKVRAQREVEVTLKLEPLNMERTALYSGSGTWEELCFDFADVGGNITGLTLIFDNGVAGDAAGDPDSWTFQFDDIAPTSAGCGADDVPPPAEVFAAITFDDPEVNYTLADFNGSASVITNDPAGGMNMVALSVRTDTALEAAGTTVGVLEGNSVPRLPLNVLRTTMTVRVFAPAAGIPVRMKIENAEDGNVSVEAEASTTVANDWETLVFDFANQVPGTAQFDPAATYSKISIFFNFGALGADVGEQMYYFDDIDVGEATDDNADPDELTLNGNFETGTLDGWTLFDNGGQLRIEDMDASEGSFSGNLIAGPGQNPVIKQEFLAVGTVMAGDTVSISLDMKATFAGAGPKFVVEFFTEQSGDGVFPQTIDDIQTAPADWTNFSYTATVGDDPARGITLQLVAICSGDQGCLADVLIDNVSVKLVP
ncbi:MAG: hypothetical protein AAGA68_11270 [Pseudomonadota bacterium]